MTQSRLSRTAKVIEKVRFELKLTEDRIAYYRECLRVAPQDFEKETSKRFLEGQSDSLRKVLGWLGESGNDDE